ncbi:hypothetical protein ACQ4LE_001873 [Meloidogyne hapla]
MFYQMLIESLLDSLKFLDYSKLSILQQVNRQFFVFIKRYRNELALKEFSQIEIIADNDVRLSVYRRAVDVVNEVEEQFGSEIYDFELNEDQREKWIDALENHIPLYLSEAILEMSQANDVDSFLIFITRKEIDNIQQPQLCIELPYYPATISDLCYIRFWLFQLSQCIFNSSDFSRAIFNPQLVCLLFCNFNSDGSQLLKPGIQFQSNSVWLNTGSFITENQEEHQHTLKFVEKYLNIYCKLHLRVHAYFDGLLHFLLNFGGKVEQVVFHYGPGHLNVELHNLLVYHAEMSKNCLKIIPKICFENADDFPWPDLCTKTKIIEEGNVEDGLYLTKYKILNYYSSSVYFLIKIFHLFGAGEFKRFEIERINI